MKRIDVNKLNNFSRKGRDRVRNTAIVAGTIGTLYGAEQWKDFVDTHRFDKNIMATNSSDGLKLGPPRPEESDLNNEDMSNEVISMDNFSNKKGSLAKKVVAGVGLGAVGLGAAVPVATGGYKTHSIYRDIIKNLKDSDDISDLRNPAQLDHFLKRQLNVKYVPHSIKQKIYSLIRDSIGEDGKIDEDRINELFEKLKDASIGAEHIDDVIPATNIVDRYIVYPKYNEQSLDGTTADEVKYLHNFSKSIDKKSLAKKVAAGLGAGASLAAGAGSLALLNDIRKEYNDYNSANNKLIADNSVLRHKVDSIQNIMRNPDYYDQYRERLLEAQNDPEKMQKLLNEINSLPEGIEGTYLKGDIVDNTIPYYFSKKSNTKKEKALAAAGLLTTAGGLTGSYIAANKSGEAERYNRELRGERNDLEDRSSKYDNYLKEPKEYVNAFKKTYGKENMDEPLGHDYYKETNKYSIFNEFDKDGFNYDKPTYKEGDTSKILKDAYVDSTLKKIYNPNLEKDSKDTEEVLDKHDAFLTDEDRLALSKFERSYMNKMHGDLSQLGNNTTSNNDVPVEKFDISKFNNSIIKNNFPGISNPPIGNTGVGFKSAVTNLNKPLDTFDKIIEDSKNNKTKQQEETDNSSNAVKVMEENENTELDPVVEYFYSDIDGEKKFFSNSKSPIALPNGKFSKVYSPANVSKLDLLKQGLTWGAGLAAGGLAVNAAAAGALYAMDAYDFSDQYSKRRKAIAGTVAGLGGATALGLGGKWLYDNQFKPLPQVSDHSGLNPNVEYVPGVGNVVKNQYKELEYKELERKPLEYQHKVYKRLERVPVKRVKLKRVKLNEDEENSSTEGYDNNQEQVVDSIEFSQKFIRKFGR